MEKKTNEPIRKDKSILTFFLVFFPTLVIALSSNILISVALMIYQGVVLKQFIDEYYKYYKYY